MFTALILSCAQTAQSPSTLTCDVFKSAIIFKTYDTCLEGLGYGIAETENQGWIVRDYMCIDWTTKKRGDAI